MDLRFRFATPADAAALAPLNAALIRDEGHRNPMTVPELEQRLAAWLAGEYRAVMFEGSGLAGYALYRRDPEHVYLRQFYVVPDQRRHGVGRAALEWLWVNAWQDAPRLRVDVLAGNREAQAFWRAVGLQDYCVVMEMDRPAKPALRAVGRASTLGFICEHCGSPHIKRTNRRRADMTPQQAIFVCRACGEESVLAEE